MGSKRYNMGIVEDLNKTALDAFGAGNYFQSAIINFQRLDFMLRLVSTVFAREIGVVPRAISEIDEEKSFKNIVVFFSFVKPKNDLSERLFELNRKRNSFIHKIFIDFEDVESLNKELKEFSFETIELIRNLSKLFEPYLQKKEGKT